MAVAYIGLGSNMHEPLRQVRTAMSELDAIKLTTIVKTSSLYKSQPVGPQDQDDFINAVAMLETDLSPEALLDQLQAIENQHQRVRDRHWGPRTLDLDILLYDRNQMNNERLTIPHKEIANRAFVLLPLFELAPDLAIPGIGNITQLIDKLDEQRLEKLE